MNDETGNRSSAQSEGAPALAGEAFRANYVQFQYDFVEFFTEHLSDLSRAFRGDLQMVLVLAVVGQVRLRDHIDQRPDDGTVRIPGGIASSRLADVTGIPRETVRRKLNSLAKMGWVERVDGALWRISMDGQKSVARRELNELDMRAVDRVARMFCRLERIVRRHGVKRSG